MREIDPGKTSRAYAFAHWLNAPMPMVTFFKTLNVTPLVKLARRKHYKFNMLMGYCIGTAASGIKEFYMLPSGNKLYEYNKLAVNTIVANNQGEVSSCDIPFEENLENFNRSYLDLTRRVAKTCANHDLQDYMVIGTSNIAKYDIDGAVLMYSGIYNNPFLIWGKYQRHLFKTILKVSFQFHHVQMDGPHAARFMTDLQHRIDNMSRT